MRFESSGWRGFEPTRRACVVAVALLASPLVIALTGCGVRLAGHSIDPFHRSARSGASRRADERREAAEQARLAPLEPYWPFRIAELDLAADSTQAAERMLAAALERDPCFAPALALRSKRQYQVARHAEAIEMLEAARSRCPNGFSEELAAGLALHYDALDQVDSSSAVMARIESHDSERIVLAALYLKLKGEGGGPADGMAKSAMEAHPKSAVHQNNFGLTRMRAGDAAGARAAFLAAIERDPALPGPYYNLAILDKYFTLDEAAAAHWFELYWERSRRDPDGLATVFGKDEPKPTAAQKEDP